jgi:anaerobic magnesium-protoporphyrin IX monomethyl ester cyclase
MYVCIEMRNKKVVVTNPPWPGPGYGARSDVRWPHKRKDKYLEYPIYLSYAVAVLEKSGFEVLFIDGVAEELSISEFVGAVKKTGADIVIIECSTPSIRYDLLTAEKLKEEMCDIFVVLAGSHPTFFHEEILMGNEFIDVICRGEFDLTGRDIAVALSNGGELSEIKGISFRDEDGVHVNEERPLLKNLDELPFPARHIVKIAPYLAGICTGNRPTTMVSSRGCPYRCVYCLWPKTLYGSVFRARSPENVVDEIEQLVNEYHVDEIYFDDDCLTLNKKRLLKICALIKERNIDVKWICQSRVDTVDEEMLKEMKEAGCHYMEFGVESGAQEILNVMKKGMALDSARKAFALCKKIGLKTQAYFLFGLPGENYKTFRKTVEFAKELDPDSAQFALAIPHPGTELYQVCEEKGWLKYDSWADFSAGNSLIETEELSREDAEKFRLDAYREFYMRPSFIIKTAFKMRGFKDARRIVRGARSIVERMSYFREEMKSDKVR